MSTTRFSEDDLLAYVQGRASAELTGRIAEAATNDPALSADIALMQALKPGLADQCDSAPTTEFGWKKLERALEADRRAAVQTTPPATPWYFKIAAALLAVIVVGQAAYIATRDDQSVFRTASDAEDGFVLGVAFAADASMTEVANLLVLVNAQIVEGPSALNLFRLSFASDTAMTEGRARLNASDLVTLIAEE